MLAIFNSFIYLFAILIKRFDVFDIFWGIGFILITFYNAIKSDFVSNTGYLVWILIILWGLRLSFRLGRRFVLSKEEDFRYLLFHTKPKNGPIFQIVENYLRIALLQAFLALFIALPIIFIFHISLFSKQHYFISILGMILALTGLIIEAWSDFLLDSFRSKSNIKNNQILDTGLFAYSRHPNYLGEIIFWSGLYFVALSYGGWWTIVSPVLITILLTQISGVPMVEQKMRQNPAYRAYSQKVPAILPNLRKILFGKISSRHKHNDRRI